MPNSKVFLDNIFEGVSDETKTEYLKVLEKEILSFTKLKNEAGMASSVAGQPKVHIAMYDFGNLSGLVVSAMGFAIKLRTIAFFAKQSILLAPSDITITLSGSLKL